MSADTRADFAPSPRPVLPVSSAFQVTLRQMQAQAACLNRTVSSTRTYVRTTDRRCWRWLFLPPHPPIQDDRS